MNDLRGKTALITGASKGIGRRLALDLAAEGVNLGLVARSAPELNQVKAEAEQAGATVLTFVGSVANEAVAEGSVAALLGQFGRIDFLVNNAGYGLFGPTESYSEKAWSELYDTN